jgi:D-3-phosphoglycerate dehydrogenase
MGKILANDGIDAIGKKMLEDAGHTVLTQNVPQDQLADYINSEKVDALLVRSATKVRKDLIDQCENLRFIGRGGVGMDNIDVEYARSKGKTVSNTPAASSLSVAELVIAHMFAKARFVDISNKQMIEADASFKDLKAAYAKGVELKGKKIGIIGFGRIGQAVASYAIGLGMEVLAFDPFVKSADITLTFFNQQQITFNIKTLSLDEVIENADFITCHVPGGEILGASQFAKMKKGVILINTARGGVINELELIEALNSGRVAGAALDVFNNEPNPDKQLILHSKISVTPHIGAATNEAQGRIAIEMAQILIDFFKQ